MAQTRYQIIMKTQYVNEIKSVLHRYPGKLLHVIIPKSVKFASFCFIMVIALFAKPLHSQNIVFSEGFESGSLPLSWQNLYVQGTINWDVRTGAGLISPGVIGDPDTAAFGNYNAVFQYQSLGQEVTKLVTPPLDLEFVVFPELTFWHAQNVWASNEELDRLKVYYKTSESEPWILLAEYLNETPVWTERVIPLPNGSPTYYIAFEGINGYGMGVCIDEIKITETGYVPRFVTKFQTKQASTEYVSTGSSNNLILQSEVRVFGNQGSCVLESFKVKSLNTNDNDISPNGVKLWATTGDAFSNPVQLGSGVSFVGGVATFNGLDRLLPTGYSYYWVSFDVSPTATHGNFADAQILAKTVLINDTLYPSINQSPDGSRVIYETLFEDNFESDKGWIINGEWERNIPEGLGGSSGGADPLVAYNGDTILGTDLTGLGEYPGDYEPGLLEHEYYAISPAIDCFYYTNVTLRFHRWLNIEITDKANIQVTYDEGATWQTVWTNQSFNIANAWSQQTVPLTPMNRKSNARFRFTLGPTDFNDNYSGWNIDNLVVTGDYVTKDVGVIGWLNPNGQCGLSSQEEVTVVVKNFGALASPAVIPVGFSLDGGATWQKDTIIGSIPVDGTVTLTFDPKADFSIPGRYQVLAKTFLASDQDASNDTLKQMVFAIPTIQPPYTENFELNDGLWDTAGVNNSWNWGVPASWNINTAGSGNFAWVTNLQGNYNQNEVSFLISPCFDFTGIDRPVFEFRYRTHLPASDGFTIQYSLNGGVSWQFLTVEEPQFAWNWYPNTDISSLQTYYGVGQGWSGDNGAWQRARMILPSYLGNQPNVKFRFGFAGLNTENSYEGVGIDLINVYQAPHDVGVDSFIQPVSFCELSDEETIAVSVKNFGFSTIEAGTMIPVGVDLNTDAPVIEEFELTNELAPGESVSFTFVTPFNMAPVGSYAVRAYTMLPGDTDFYTPGVFNDTLMTSVSVFGYPQVSLGPDIYTTEPETVLLDAGSGFTSYLWNTGDETQTYQVTSPYTAVYSVTVTDDNNCPAWDSINVITYDLAVTEIQQPLSACELTTSEQITIGVQNMGVDPFQPGLSFMVTLEPLGLDPITETIVLEEILEPNQLITHTFSQIFDMSSFGAYTYNISIDFVDADPVNNTKQTTVFAYGYPDVSLGDDIYTLDPLSVILSPGSQYSTYLWQDGSAGQSFSVTSVYSGQYNVTVTDEHGCPGSDTVWVYTFDFEVEALINPLDACSLSENEAISISIKNNGPDIFASGLELPLTIIMDENILAEETLNVSTQWEPGQSITHTFVPTVDLSLIGTYNFKAYFDLKDADDTNDTLQLAVTHHGYPVPLLPELIVTNQPDSVILDPGSGFTSYLWSTGSSDQTIAISTWGLYTVTVSNSFGCVTIDSVVVEPERFDFGMNELLSPYTNCEPGSTWPVVLQLVNTGNMEILAGSLLYVSYQLDGATPIAHQVPVTESILPGGALEYSFPLEITLPEGEYNFYMGLTYELDEVASNNTLTRIVNVYPPASVDLGPDIYTNTPEEVILDAGPGFETYLWQDGSTNQTFQVNFPTTAAYYVTVTNSNGCEASDTVWVVTFSIDVANLIQPVSNCTLSTAEPVIVELTNPGPDTFEPGYEFTLSYKMNMLPVRNKHIILNSPWGVGENMNVTFDNTEDLSQTGLYLFKVYTNLQNSDTLTSIVYNDGIPQIYFGPDIYTTMPDTIVLDAGSGFESYLWHDGSTAQTFDVSTFGFHWAQVTDTYGCTNRDTIYIGFGDNIAVWDLNKAIRVYPNPASEKLYIESEGVNGEAVIQIVNMNGQQVIFKKLIDDDWNKPLEIDVSHLTRGVYILNVSSKNWQKAVRINIQ